MKEFCTLDQAKAYSRIQHTALDSNIQLLIYSSSAIIENYLDGVPAYKYEADEDGNPLLDSNEEPFIEYDSSGPIVRDEVRLACLYLVDLYLKDKATAAMPADGYPPAVVQSLLYPLRVPTVR